MVAILSYTRNTESGFFWHLLFVECQFEFLKRTFIQGYLFYGIKFIVQDDTIRVVKTVLRAAIFSVMVV